MYISYPGQTFMWTQCFSSPCASVPCNVGAMWRSEEILVYGPWHWQGLARRSYILQNVFECGFHLDIIMRVLLLCKLWCFSSTLYLHVSAMGTAMYHVTLWGELGVCSDERSPNLPKNVQTLIILREEIIGQISLRRMQCFSSSLCLHEGAVGTIPCDALRACSLVWRDVWPLISKEFQTELSVHLSQKSFKLSWCSCVCCYTLWGILTEDRLGYGLMTGFNFVKESLEYGRKGCHLISNNQDVDNLLCAKLVHKRGCFSSTLCFRVGSMLYESFKYGQTECHLISKCER